MIDLRKLARGEECQVRLVGICTFNREQTVLAHFRLVGMSGMGVKNHDLFGAYACAACHAVCDGQMASDLSRDQRMLALAEGVFRTQALLLRRGVIAIGGSHDTRTSAQRSDEPATETTRVPGASEARPHEQ